MFVAVFILISSVTDLTMNLLIRLSTLTLIFPYFFQIRFLIYYYVYLLLIHLHHYKNHNSQVQNVCVQMGMFN